MKLFNLIFSSIGFLTGFPVNKVTEPSYKLFLLFPLTGLLMGMVCGCFFKFSNIFFNKEISVLFALAGYIILGDILHMDGFSDTVDALFASVKKRTETVFKDPHIGVCGCVYVVLLVLVKFILLKNLQNVFSVIIILPVISRWSMSVVGFFGKPLNWSTLGSKFVYKDIRILLFSTLIAVLCLIVFIRNFRVVILLFLTFFTSIGFTKFFNFKFNGVNGDIFGFISEVNEVFVLMSIPILHIC